MNVHGLPGKNIPNDLHMEHLNRLVKTALKELGANKTEKAIITIGKILGVIGPVIEMLIWRTKRGLIQDHVVEQVPRTQFSAPSYRRS